MASASGLTKYQLNRTLTKTECPWLEKPINEGTMVWEKFGDSDTKPILHDGALMANVGAPPGFITVTLQPYEQEGFNVPYDAVTMVR